jgi:anaphase-promoting complex subunit 1
VAVEKQVETGKGRRGKEKGKKAASGRGKKKVSLGGTQHEVRGGEVQKRGQEFAAVEGSWWLRDSVIEELKGRTWLAGRQ